MEQLCVSCLNLLAVAIDIHVAADVVFRDQEVVALSVQGTLELWIECFYPLIAKLVNIRRLMV